MDCNFSAPGIFLRRHYPIKASYRLENLLSDAVLESLRLNHDLTPSYDDFPKYSEDLGVRGDFLVQSSKIISFKSKQHENIFDG